ncbi:MAG TPA: GNAT family N-acetyltransferase [Burkholderiales bacterium]|nr:GNAT family N-acetyltransferase [Burkholderiales bacterium]
MASSEPWLTLGTGYERSLKLLNSETRERYLAKVAGEPAGFLVVSMQGAFVGYIQLLGVAEKFRGQGVGRALIEYAEQRIFRDTPNVFICVSDFNRVARAFYARMGYQSVGELKDFIVAGHSEILLRKTIGPIRGKKD